MINKCFSDLEVLCEVPKESQGKSFHLCLKVFLAAKSQLFAKNLFHHSVKDNQGGGGLASHPLELMMMMIQTETDEKGGGGNQSTRIADPSISQVTEVKYSW